MLKDSSIKPLPAYSIRQRWDIVEDAIAVIVSSGAYIT